MFRNDRFEKEVKKSSRNYSKVVLIRKSTTISTLV